MIAEAIEKYLELGGTVFEKVEIAGPGFINVSLTDEYIIKYLNQVLNDFDALVDKEQEKTIIIDYGGAHCRPSGSRI